MLFYYSSEAFVSVLWLHFVALWHLSKSASKIMFWDKTAVFFWHFFIWFKFSGYLFCARHWARWWGYSDDRVLLGLHSLEQKSESEHQDLSRGIVLSVQCVKMRKGHEEGIWWEDWRGCFTIMHASCLLLWLCLLSLLVQSWFWLFLIFFFLSPKSFLPSIFPFQFKLSE